MKIDKNFIWGTIPFVLSAILTFIVVNISDPTSIFNMLIIFLLWVMPFALIYFIVEIKPQWLQAVAISAIMFPHNIQKYMTILKSRPDIEPMKMFETLNSLDALISIVQYIYLLFFAYVVIGKRVSYSTRIFYFYLFNMYVFRFLNIHYLPNYPSLYSTGVLFLTTLLAYPIQYLWERKRIHE